MKTLFSCILLVSLSHLLIGQQENTFKQEYHEIGLSNLISEIEKKSNFTFYYKNEWISSIVISEVKAGTPFGDFLASELINHGLKSYTQGQQIFIYPGPEITTELPKYDKPRSLLQQPKYNAKGEIPANEYIKTRKVLEEQVILIGEKQNIVYGKKCHVKGSIINQKNNEPLIGATIYNITLEKGTISDVNGTFSLSIDPGEYNISVHHMAMKKKQYVLRVYSDGEFSILLQDEITELEEVTISSDRFDNVKSMQMGFDKISIKAMKEIPIVMGEKDILKVAQMLPGVQTAGEGSSGFNVRGGSADQNMFYMNNISVYNTSHLFGFFTAFSPDVISDFSLYKNNIPTKYGGRIASVFEISTRQGNKNKLFAQGGISPVTGHFSIEGPIIKNKVSVVASFRSTYSDWILKQMKDENLRESNASFYDGTLGINADINEDNTLSLFFYKSSDKFSLSTTNDYSYSNFGTSVIWKHKFTKNLSSDFSYANSNYQFSTVNKINITEAYIQNYSIDQNELRADFLLLKYDNHRIEFGANSIFYNLDRGSIDPYGEASTWAPLELGKEVGLENAIYISDEISLLPKLSVMTGLRYSFYTQLGPREVLSYIEGLPLNINNVSGSTSYNPGQIIKTYSGLEPRLALNYLLNEKSAIKASYNRLHQYIFLLSNTFAIAPNDQWKLTDTHISPPRADQLSIGYYRDNKEQGLSFSFELYNKWVQNIVAYKNGADFISGAPLEQEILQGSQSSRGAEFMLKKNSGKLKGWLSYTYSRSTNLITGEFPSERINNGLAYPSNNDRPHSLNLVSNLRANRRLSMSTNVVYSSGRPITLPISIYYSEGQQLLLYSNRNQYRIPDYFRIDFSVNLEGNLKHQKIGHSYWMLNIYNLTGRKNAYSVYYKAEEGKINGYKLSIFARPIVTLSWQFKLGNYSND